MSIDPLYPAVVLLALVVVLWLVLRVFQLGRWVRRRHAMYQLAKWHSSSPWGDK